ncbi:SDR family NAD(P)-dependent oxidoreductase [Devosia sp. LjRoot16]|uniref:SDR family NAD(P)-dependent oxidoreductase n=1 Tax=unclassified Devosia TaxID=196773 RepID=UPI0006F59D9D|nr:SDR family oxidoreductase [Devosia sp. Root105]KQU95108.1 3-oxoacyl-ACP reductase [Devosia sp. Root105]
MTGASYPSLRGQVVFVSGGASGIGAEMVAQFTRQGAQAAFVDIDDTSAEALVAALAAEGHAAPLYQHCDIRDIAALRLAIAAVIERFGPINTLVNNAASDDPHTIAEVEPDYWDERMARNLRHHFFAAQAVRPAMAGAGGGSIINIGSTVWLFGAPKTIAYATAKAAITGMTRSMARELGPENIRVNCVIPGWVMTPRQLATYIDDAAEQQIATRQSLSNRRIQPADIANMVLFLAADESRSCAGQNFIVDAGWV